MLRAIELDAKIKRCVSVATKMVLQFKASLKKFNEGSLRDVDTRCRRRKPDAKINRCVDVVTKTVLQSKASLIAVKQT